MKTPAILVTTYNRPYLTGKLLEVLGEIKPKKLFVSSDGPKNKKDEKLVLETRNLFDNLNWQCQVYKNYSNENLGLRRRMSSAITWFFEKVESGIILEDDCIPNKSFFRYCTELLQKYKDEEKIMHISGDNFLKDKKEIQSSYYFSKYSNCWGWASWKRAWRKYDDEMKKWPKLKKSGWLEDILDNKLTAIYWNKIFDLTYQGKIDSWAYRWQYSCWVNKGLAINPRVNLIKNIGQSKDATNTKFDLSAHSISAKSLGFPLRHPERIKVSQEADKITERERFVNTRNILGLVYKTIFYK